MGSYSIATCFFLCFSISFSTSFSDVMTCLLVGSRRSASSYDVRASAKHPVPMRSLVDFQRVTVAPGQSQKVHFVIEPSSLSLTDENGEPRLYKGTHTFVASRGHGTESIFNMTLA